MLNLFICLQLPMYYYLTERKHVEHLNSVGQLLNTCKLKKIKAALSFYKTKRTDVT